MESFFLSETAKYLFLLGAGAGDLPDFFVLTTEGHLLPPLPATAAHSAGFSHLTTPDGAALLLAGDVLVVCNVHEEEARLSVCGHESSAV